MQFTVVKLFHHKSFGLDAPHYAVVADMPTDMGGGQRVVDLFPLTDVASAAGLREAFANAKRHMPHRVSPEGGCEVDFYTTDYKGQRVKQNTAYIPARALTGASFEQGLLDWLSWRARVGLRMQDVRRPVLSEKIQARIVETVTPPVTMPLAAIEARAVPQKPRDYMADKASVALTHGPAPL